MNDVEYDDEGRIFYVGISWLVATNICLTARPVLVTILCTHLRRRLNKQAVGPLEHPWA